MRGVCKPVNAANEVREAYHVVEIVEYVS